MMDARGLSRGLFVKPTSMPGTKNRRHTVVCPKNIDTRESQCWLSRYYSITDHVTIWNRMLCSHLNSCKLKCITVFSDYASVTSSSASPSPLLAFYVNWQMADGAEWFKYPTVQLKKKFPLSFLGLLLF